MTDAPPDEVQEIEADWRAELDEMREAGPVGEQEITAAFARIVVRHVARRAVVSIVGLAYGARGVR